MNGTKAATFASDMYAVGVTLALFLLVPMGPVDTMPDNDLAYGRELLKHLVITAHQDISVHTDNLRTSSGPREDAGVSSFWLKEIRERNPGKTPGSIIQLAQSLLSADPSDRGDASKALQSPFVSMRAAREELQQRAALTQVSTPVMQSPL